MKSSCVTYPQSEVLWPMKQLYPGSYDDEGNHLHHATTKVFQTAILTLINHHQDASSTLVAWEYDFGKSRFAAAL